MASHYYRVLSDNQRYFASQDGWRGAVHPFSVTPYERHDNKSSLQGSGAQNLNALVWAVNNGQDGIARGICYDRFVNKLGDKSSFGATLTAELGETVETMAGLILKAAKAARQIKRFDFVGAARTLGLPYAEKKKKWRLKSGKRVTGKTYMTLPTGRTVVKTAANGWLLWSYGVKPLAEDIHTMFDIFDTPLQYFQPVKGTVSLPYFKQEIDIQPPYYHILHVIGSTKCCFGAKVTVTNPNARLRSQLGLTNPAEWVLEAIPFSFVVDWFSNLSSYVGSLTAFEGLSLTDPFVTVKVRVDTDGFDDSPWSTRKWTDNSFGLRRSSGVPQPTLRFAYERFNPSRGLNAISLLIGFLPK